jgi:hypothetical protein
MHRLIGVCILCAALLVAVPGCFRNLLLANTETQEEYDGINAYIRFYNEGKFSVDVFTDPERSIHLCSVDAGNSTTVAVNPDTHANTYYLIYHISFHGVTIPYSNQYMVLSVQPEKTTQGTIPILSDLPAEEKTKQFTGDVYIFMDNTSSNSLSLRGGSTPIDLADSSSSVLNARSNGLYKLPGSGQLNVDSYGFYSNTTTPLSWPAELTGDFQKGYLYSVEFSSDTGIKLKGKWEMTIANTLNQN